MRESQIDPLASLTGAGKEALVPDEAVLECARESFRQHRRDGTWEQGFDVLCRYVAQYPQVAKFQILAARFLEAAGHDEQAELAWAGIRKRFPDYERAFLLELSSIKKHQGAHAAEQEIRSFFSGLGTDVADRLLEARAWGRIGNSAEAESRLEMLLAERPRQEDVYVVGAHIYRKRGAFHKAREVAQAGCSLLGRTARKLAALNAELAADCNFLEEISREDGASNLRASHIVLRHLLQRIHQQRLEFVDSNCPSYLSKVLMINSTLGAGGAERQFVNTAVALQQAARGGTQIAGYDILGPVVVFCRSLTKRKGADFFVPVLERENIPVRAYSDFPRWGGCEQRSIASEYRKHLKFLPPAMADGVMRLTDMIRVESPSIVHIWQDGSILATVLAALLAEVPRIVLSVRTLPPVDRPDRYHPEYDVLYPSLLKMPGVVLNANSKFSAARYASWIGVNDADIPVIYNGLEPFSHVGNEASVAMKQAFFYRTGEAVRTVGTIMRIDENKRPFLWLDGAKEFLRRHAGTRFIIVGDGPLKVDAEEYARQIGISENVLFTGLSDDIGFWLKSLDVFLLLSRFEGLPNVLIEAQFAGVPVVTTPAGGAAEALIAGKTGFVFDGLEPSVQDIALALETVFCMRDTDSKIAEQARLFAADNFSIQNMATATVHSYLEFRHDVPEHMEECHECA